MRPAIALLLAAIFVFPASSQRASLSDHDVKQQIIRESIARYQSNGAPCACPYSTARNGSRCGARSAHSRPGGAAPMCFDSDVTAAMVLDWRKRHPD